MPLTLDRCTAVRRTGYMAVALFAAVALADGEDFEGDSTPNVSGYPAAEWFEVPEAVGQDAFGERYDEYVRSYESLIQAQLYGGCFAAADAFAERAIAAESAGYRSKERFETFRGRHRNRIAMFAWSAFVRDQTLLSLNTEVVAAGCTDRWADWLRTLMDGAREKGVAGGIRESLRLAAERADKAAGESDELSSQPDDETLVRLVAATLQETIDRNRSEAESFETAVSEDRADGASPSGGGEGEAIEAGGPSSDLLAAKKHLVQTETSFHLHYAFEGGAPNESSGPLHDAEARFQEASRKLDDLWPGWQAGLEAAVEAEDLARNGGGDRAVRRSLQAAGRPSSRWFFWGNLALVAVAVLWALRRGSRGRPTADPPT